MSAMFEAILNGTRSNLVCIGRVFKAVQNKVKLYTLMTRVESQMAPEQLPVNNS